MCDNHCNCERRTTCERVEVVVIVGQQNPGVAHPSNVVWNDRTGGWYEATR